MTGTSPITNSWIPLFAAFTLALGASVAVLFVGEVLGQAPCNLCWFQRAFMFPLAVILGVGAVQSDTAVIAYGLALAGIGWLIAGFHSLLYAGIIPEAIKPCTAGPSCSGDAMTILGGLPLPILSLLTFTTIIALLILAHRKAPS